MTPLFTDANGHRSAYLNLRPGRYALFSDRWTRILHNDKVEILSSVLTFEVAGKDARTSLELIHSDRDPVNVHLARVDEIPAAEMAGHDPNGAA